MAQRRDGHSSCDLRRATDSHVDLRPHTLIHVVERNCKANVFEHQPEGTQRQCAWSGDRRERPIPEFTRRNHTLAFRYRSSPSCRAIGRTNGFGRSTNSYLVLMHGLAQRLFPPRHIFLHFRAVGGRFFAQEKLLDLALLAHASSM